MKKYIHLIIIFISFATIFSGLLQLFFPGFVLNIIGATVNETSSYFFSIVGMFMSLFGGLMLHAIYSSTPQRPAILWCSFQKLGAFFAVGIGVLWGIFSPIAASVAFFDLFSGILFLFYLKRISP